MKKGPLSKVEKSYIENNIEEGVIALAKSLDRSENIVQKFIKKTTEEETKPDSSNLYVRDSNKVATIMTEAASMAADESRKEPYTPNRYRGVIHKIKKED